MIKIETTFVGGINPFMCASQLPPESIKPYAQAPEPLKKTHPVYEWVRDNPMKTYREIAAATGRPQVAVKQITLRMAAYGLLVHEQCPKSSVAINRVRVAP